MFYLSVPPQGPTLGSWALLFPVWNLQLLACNSLRKNCITDFSWGILKNCLGFRFSNVSNCRSLEISRRATFWNTSVQVEEFPRKLYIVAISPITLLKSDSASNFEKSENSHEIFLMESTSRIVIDSKLDSELYPPKTFFWKFCMACSFLEACRISIQ